MENETLVVRSGSSLFGSGGEVYNVVEKTKYPNSEAVKDDIALLKVITKFLIQLQFLWRTNTFVKILFQLDRPIKFSKIQSPIALALPTDTWASGKKLFVCGFGRTQVFAFTFNENFLKERFCTKKTKTLIIFWNVDFLIQQILNHSNIPAS